jgi:hypothetical protein
MSIWHDGQGAGNGESEHQKVGMKKDEMVERDIQIPSMIPRIPMKSPSVHFPNLETWRWIHQLASQEILNPETRKESQSGILKHSKDQTVDQTHKTDPQRGYDLNE